MALRALETRIWFILIRLQVRVDELDEAIEVLCRDGLVLLVEVVDVAIEDLDEEFDGDGGVHAGVCDAEGTLEAFKDAFAVAVELLVIVSCHGSQFREVGLHFGDLLPVVGFPQSTRGGLPDIPRDIGQVF